jgi:GrpB-like predicted nucleotidyltransferase (UPF0157 family)
MSKHNYAGRKYEVVAYDSEWPKLFKSEADKLRDIFQDNAVSMVMLMP